MINVKNNVHTYNIQDKLGNKNRPFLKSKSFYVSFDSKTFVSFD